MVVNRAVVHQHSALLRLMLSPFCRWHCRVLGEVNDPYVLLMFNIGEASGSPNVMNKCLDRRHICSRLGSSESLAGVGLSTEGPVHVERDLTEGGVPSSRNAVACA